MKNSAVRDMMDAIRETTPKESGYDTVAEVRRVEDGTAWVHIPGGVDETPVSLTIDAKAGDQVQVRVGGGSAWLVGNASAPPTDDYIANIARGEASAANQRASTAMESAEEARAAADDAIASAATAAAAASAAQTSANEAKTSATNASEYASRALGNLSTVQSVAETLTWITQHGTMTLTSDTEPDPTHVYFVRDANGDYEVGSYKYSIVSEPDADDMSTYYELSIDESLNNYVGTHLAVTAEGLWVLPAATNSYKVLIATGLGTTYDTAGTYIIDDSGGTVSFFGLSSRIGAEDAPHIDVSDSGISGYNKDAVPFFFIDMEGGSSSTSADKTISAGIRFAAERKKIWNTNPISLCSGSKELGDISSSGTIRISKLPFLFSVYEGVDLTGDVVASSGLTYTRPTSRDCMVDLSSAVTFTVGTSDSDLRWIHIKRSDNSYLAIQVVVNYDGDDTISYTLMGYTSTGTASSGFTTIELKSINIEITYPVPTKAPIYSFGFRSADDKGAYSAIIGEGLAASSDNQVVIGKYNVDDTNGAYEFIVGNGSGDSSRSNAYAVTWDGDEHIALNTSAASGTTDGKLYAAITALGWASEVIV